MPHNNKLRIYSRKFLTVKGIVVYLRQLIDMYPFNYLISFAFIRAFSGNLPATI